MNVKKISARALGSIYIIPVNDNTLLASIAMD